MTEEKTALPSKAAEEPQKKTTQPQAPASSRRPTMITIILCLLLLSLAAGVGFLAYQVYLLNQDKTALNRDIQRINRQLITQEQNVGSQKNQHANTQNQIEGLTSQLDRMHQTLQQIPGARVEDWKLAEAEYLLRLANQRAELQQEAKGALGLLKSADAIIAELDDPALLHIREQLASDQLALGVSASFDRQGLYFQLEAIKKQVHAGIQPPRTFKNEVSQTADVITGTALSEDIATLQSYGAEPVQGESSAPINEATPEPYPLLTQFWQQLKGLVRLRHRDQAFDAPLSAEQYQLLEHSLILMLEQAQWALLKADQGLYDSSLHNAIQWLDGKLRHQAVLPILDALRALQAHNISLQIPDISRSLFLLREVMHLRTYAPTPIPTPPSQDAPASTQPPAAPSNRAPASSPAVQPGEST